MTDLRPARFRRTLVFRTMSQRKRPPKARRGFIILFGTRGLSGQDSAPPVDAQCPNCRQQSTIVGKVYRQWFTLFFIPVFPISGKTRMSECTRCKAVFRVPVEEFGQRVSAGSQ